MATDEEQRLDDFVKRMSDQHSVIIVGLPEVYVDLPSEATTSSGYNEPGDDDDAISHREISWEPSP